MHTIRQTCGLAGFPKRDESLYDAFGAGHSSTSISAGLGTSNFLTGFIFKAPLQLKLFIKIKKNEEAYMLNYILMTWAIDLYFLKVEC